MNTIEITQNNFEQTLNKNEIVILDFWASWCGPCKMFSPVFEKIASRHPDIVFGKVNTETEEELSASFDIRSIPTLMIFRQKTLLLVQPGVVPENAFEELITQVKALDMDKVKEEIAKQENTQGEMQ